ncbi:hypothetical protein VTN00DRAFT_2051 [Thermoascus crustaceus]|uniref:uncharacterized protein n=1 Tax=Thermoascus crustaceus TaxID=5088 RepID=UPI0037432B2A
MESSPPRSGSTAPVAGMKRPASLLPAFEPLSSSPSLPRPQKRVLRGQGDITTYPTPVPTSSTHIMSSSPPRMPMSRISRHCTSSMTSERAPLSAVPTVMLPESGERILMGRSSASCHYQLSANRLISRVHVEAAYMPAPNPFDRDRIEIKCTGWNGIKLHCQGKTYDLAKGKTFTSDIKDADVMIDVQDARVLVQWPRRDRKDTGSASDHTWDEDSPRRTIHDRCGLQESPLRQRQRLVSPVSPSPAVQSLIPPSSPLLTPSYSRNSVVVYEDEPSPARQPAGAATVSQTTQGASLQSSRSSDLSDLSKLPEDYSDHDEENDPIVHSFGPYGENILPRMAFNAAGSPIRSTRPSRPQPQPLKPTNSTAQPTAPKPEETKKHEEVKHKDATKPEETKSEETGKSEEKAANTEKDERIATIQNHAVNQLAFSRLSSTPFSTILSNLPPGLVQKDGSAEGASRSEIRSILDSTKCIGKVTREGKDAAGKPLESEYYYIADFDEDQMRREAVVNDLRKPGLRNCRKQHKQYFWRKPK